MNKFFVSLGLSLVLSMVGISQGGATMALSNVASQSNQAFLASQTTSGYVLKVQGLGKAIRKLNPGKLPSFKGVPSRPKVALPPRGLQPPKGLSNAPSVRAAPPSSALKAPSRAAALPPSTATRLPPANGLRNAPGGGFQRGTVPTGPRRFDGDTVGIGSKSVRKANTADNVPASVAKPGAWKQKAITGGIGVFLVLQFAPDIIISQIDFSTEEENAAAGN